MNLLVTGAAGFIGANFVHYWNSKYPKDNLKVIDSLTYASNIENLSSVIKDIEFIQADINDRQKVSEALKGIDAVVHFAAESHVDRSVYDPSKYWHTNVHGTLVLLEETHKKGITRFHHISTDEVYGELPLNSDIKFTEETPYSPKPDNIYALSKAEADKVVLDFCERTGMFITISNCSNNYGPYQFPEKFIPIVVTNIIDGIKVPIHGDGRNVRDWIHVKDHSTAVDTILNKGKKGETYLIGTNNDRSNSYIASRIIELCGLDSSIINHVPDRHSNDRRYAIDPSKIMKELGWKPTVNREDFDEGLKETINWYKDNQRWWRPLLQKKDTVSDSTGKFSAYISLDRVNGKTKFQFNEITNESSVKKTTKEDFLTENKIRYDIVIKNLESKGWYKNSSKSVQEEIEKLGKNPSTFGYVEDLSSREDQINGSKILSLIKVEHAEKNENIYGIATWFEVEESSKKRVVYGYYSWGMGTKSGSKIILLVKNKEKVTHIGLVREEKLPTGFIEYTLAGGFSGINEGLLDLLIRYLKVDFDVDVLNGDLIIDKIVSLGRVNPDSGMTNNKPSLYAITVSFKNKYENIKIDETVEENQGVVLWPISKINDFVNKCDDSYLLSAIARLDFDQINKS